MSSEPAPLLLVLALLLTAAAAYSDLRTALIPNRLVAVGAGVLLCARLLPAAPAGFESVLWALALGALGVLVTGLVPLLLYRLGGIGGGDVKLLGALGLGLGPLHGLEAELYAFALTLLYAPLRLSYEGNLLRTLTASSALLLRPFMPAARKARRPIQTLTSFRFGPAIFLGTLLTALLDVGGV